MSSKYLWRLILFFAILIVILRQNCHSEIVSVDINVVEYNMSLLGSSSLTGLLFLRFLSSSLAIGGGLCSLE